MLVFSTFPDAAKAREVARMLVQEKLAACANLLPEVESIYHWKGELTASAETLVFFKTTSAAYPELEARLRASHPYEVPEIIALDITAGSPDYLRWVAEGCVVSA